MRLRQLQAHHYLTHRALLLDVPADARCVLICGPNGSGKSALLDAIRLILDGALPRGLAYKKDIPMLLTAGEKDGFVAVQLEGRDPYKLSLKTGGFAGSGPSDLGTAALALHPAGFMALEPAKRRRALFERAGISLKASDVVDKLVKEGYAEDRVKAITPSLGRGIDAAAQRARELVSEARGAWQAVTGENYGTAKGATWRAPRPAAADNITALKEDRDRAMDAYNRAAEHLQALKQSAAATARLDDLARQAKMVPDLLLQVEDAQSAVAAAQQKLDEARAARDGWRAECPHCGLEVECPRPGELVAVDDDTPALDAATAARLRDEAERRLMAAKQRLTKAQDALNAARAAQLALGELPPAPGADALRDAETKVKIARTALELASTSYDDAVRRAQEAAGADARTEKAAQAHADVLGYMELEKRLVELPGEYLTQALASINECLRSLSAPLGGDITLGEDMVLRYRGFPYELCSRSQQLRMQIALGIAFARDHGGLVLVDEFDLIEPAARGPILRMLGSDAVGAAQVILGATLKEQPKLPSGYAVFWLGKETT